MAKMSTTPNSTHWLPGLLIVMACLPPIPSSFAQSSPNLGSDSISVPEHAAGQTATLLPDGRWLLVGGIVSGEVSDTLAVVEASKRQPLELNLQIARTGHTTTTLPDGSVLVFGGTDSRGKLIAEAEIIDLASNTAAIAATTGLTRRTRHTATLLTDGRVLIAGGIGGDGRPIAAAQLWNPRTATVDVWNPLLQTPRYDHSATLSASGEGRIEGGHARNQSSPPTELFDPTVNVFEPTVPNEGPRNTSSASGEVENLAPAIAESLPAAEAVDVPVNTQIAFRFTRPLRIASLNSSTLSLIGPSGAVSVKVVGAESGMLAFMTPSAELAPGATYTAFLAGAMDLSGRQVPMASVRFTTHRFEAPTSAATKPETGSANVAALSIPSSARAPSLVPATTPAATKSAPLARPEGINKSSEDDGTEDWSPRDENRHGQWKVLGLAGDPALSAEGLSTADLTAPTGHTAVAGHVLRLNGKPIGGVVVSIGKHNATTDAKGRFLLANVPSGSNELLVDGTAVTNNGRHYTKHYLSVQATANQTTTLPQAVYLPRVDPATETAISSPAAQELVLTHPAIPGLEVHIPRGTVLRERDGKIVTTVSITPLPVNRAPYPTPLGFSAYFTLQPGGAFVDGDASKAIRVIYPNYSGAAPGTKLNFYNYDPSHGGWGVYGEGVVSKNGRQVVPAAGVGFRQLMGFGLAIGQAGPPAGPTNSCKCADPVDAATGFFVHSQTDMAIQDVIPITVARTYQSNDPSQHAFGVGTNLFYNMYIYTPNASTDSDVYLVLSDGSKIHYSLQSTSPYVWKNLDSPTMFYGSSLQYVPGQNGQINTTNDLLVLTLANQMKLNFVSDSSPNQLLSIVDAAGNTLIVTLQNGRTGPITQVTSPNGRYVQFTYDGCNRITRATDNSGRTVKYGYVPPATTCTNPLQTVTDQDSYEETYAYDTSNRMRSLTDNNGNRVFYNNYNSSNQVVNQTLADGAYWQFGYSLSDGIETTIVTNPRNYKSQYTFNAGGYLTRAVLAQGESVQQTYTYQLYGSNLVQKVTDPLSRTTTYVYDAYGNPTGITVQPPSVSAFSESFQYDPVFHQLASFTDIYGHTTSLTYDSTGNVNSVTNGIGHIWNVKNNGEGLPALVTDPLGNTRQFGYQGADLASVTDGLGRTSTLFTDEVGRVLTLSDPLNNTRQFAYGNRDQLLKVIDPLGGLTTYKYDKNGNLTSVTDPRRLAAHRYTPDSRNRLHIYADPLGKTATFGHDGMSNLISVKDRNGNLTQYSYDPLNRLSRVTYQDASTINIQWDGGNRPHIITDSKNGTITRTYDGLDRLTEEQSPQGTVRYTYNLSNPLLQMTVTGKPTISYDYDKANRLTSITQGSSSVTLAPDAANRPGKVTYPNGVVGTYGFDAANQLLSLDYVSGSTTISSSTYKYDLAGRQVARAGNYYRLVLPANVSQATYDAANRLTEWNGAALTYDDNGNLRTNSAGSYNWNTRNQLTATSAGSASFQYDAFGRRVSATVSGTTNTYLYDGANPALISSTQILGGRGVDEVYAQVTSSGTTSLLRDSDNSTIALSNSSATTEGNYYYSPYGATTNVGTSATPLQFTGRENDGATGLYYYRARYYSPELSRFVSQDPIGLAGGLNTYAYVGDNPLSNLDPLGLWSITIGGYYIVGGEVTIGTDDGHLFVTTRVGFGIGGGVDVDPDGGIPGITKATGCAGGFVLSASVKGDLGFGPLWNGGFEAGAFNNVIANVQNFYGEGHAGTVDLSKEAFLLNEGFHGSISIGAQTTLYR